MSRQVVKILESSGARVSLHPFSRALARESGLGALFAGSFLRTARTLSGIISYSISNCRGRQAPGMSSRFVGLG